MSKKKIKTRSGFESLVLADLDKRGVSYDYELHRFPYNKPSRVSWYTPDIMLPNRVLVECKGRFTSKDRTKMLLVREQNPEICLRILLQKDNWLTKTHKRRYSTWCKENGFEYAVGAKIPARWLKPTKSGIWETAVN